MSNILVIGSSGQLARALKTLAQTRSHDNFRFLSRSDLDLSCARDELIPALDTFLYQDESADKPAFHGVIIAAAYTAVDAAEDDYVLAERVNAQAPGIIAERCAALGIPLVHVSTDYVFTGEGRDPWRPTDIAAPINAYGRSKRAGEERILATDVRASILRTSWVFDGTGKNFLTTMLRLGADRNTLTVVSDQIGRPTYAGDLARACYVALERLIDNPHVDTEIYHASGGGVPVSWADFARAIFQSTQTERKQTVTVTDILSKDYPTQAKRPKNSVLDISKFERDHNYKFPDWVQGLANALKDREDSL